MSARAIRALVGASVKLDIKLRKNRSHCRAGFWKDGMANRTAFLFFTQENF